MEKKENTSEERCYEPFRRPKDESDESVFLNAAKTLKITITDGDYTLREGIDYTTLYIRGHGDTEMAWSAAKGNTGRSFCIPANTARLWVNSRPSGRKTSGRSCSCVT